MLKTISSMGIKSDYMYAAGLASIGLTWVAWAVSRFGADEPKPQADRWGLFTGEWAPTFIALGTALKLEEQSARSLTK